jgi:uncharacterized membrane protein
MSDTVETERPHDDAPVTTSKKASGDRALVGEAVTINRPARELYDFWREVTNLAEFMDNIESIEPIDGTRSRWRVKAPAGKTVEWESVITDDRPGRSITWQSAEGADIANSGKVEFQDAGARGTVVRAVIAYDPPAGIVGQIVAKIFQREPRLQARRDLRRFKQLMETGEIATAARTRAQFNEEKED